VTSALRAIEASSRIWHKLRVFFGEWRGCKLQQNVVLNPMLKLANWQEDALGFVGAPVLLLIASCESFFLLLRLQLGQQERVAHADFILGKGFDDSRGKLYQSQPSGLCVDGNYV